MKASQADIETPSKSEYNIDLKTMRQSINNDSKICEDSNLGVFGDCKLFKTQNPNKELPIQNELTSTSKKSKERSTTKNTEQSTTKTTGNYTESPVNEKPKFSKEISDTKKSQIVEPEIIQTIEDQQVIQPEEEKSVILFQKDPNQNNLYRCIQITDTLESYEIVLPDNISEVVHIDNTEVILIGKLLFIFNIKDKTFKELKISKEALNFFGTYSGFKCVYFKNVLYMACGKIDKPDGPELCSQFSFVDLATGEYKKSKQ